MTFYDGYPDIDTTEQVKKGRMKRKLKNFFRPFEGQNCLRDEGKNVE